MDESGFKQWTDQARLVGANLADTTAELSDVKERLQLSEKVVRSQRRNTRILIALLVVSLIIAISNRMLFNKLSSCIDDQGKCSKKNAEKTAAAVQDLKNDSLARFEELRNLVERTHNLPESPRSASTTTTSAQNRPTDSPVSPATTSTSTTTPPNSTTTTTTQPTTTTTRLCVAGVCL